MNPEVSCIVCHHTGKLIDNCIKSIQASIGVTYEIIVVSSDPYYRHDGVTVLFSTQGPASKRNIASCIAKGKYLAFFDDDVEIEPTCLKELVQPFVFQHELGIVYGKLYNMEHRNRFDEAGSYLTWTGFMWSRAEQNVEDIDQYPFQELVLSGKSASCAIRADIFKEVGMFDDDFWILGEETDLAWRVWLANYTVIYTPHATAYHAFNTKFKPVEKFYTSKRVHYNGCRNYITMLIKNLEFWNLVKILPVHVMIWFLAGFMLMLRGKFRAGLYIWQGIWYNVSRLKSILAKRNLIVRKLKDKDIWPYIYRHVRFSYYLQRFFRYLKIGLHG